MEERSSTSETTILDFYDFQLLAPQSEQDKATTKIRESAAEYYLTSYAGWYPMAITSVKLQEKQD